MKSIFLYFLFVLWGLFFTACSTQIQQKLPLQSTPSTVKFSTNSLNKIAIIIPEQAIKSYSNVIINSSMAYLMRRDAKIELKIFLIGTEDENKLKAVIEKLQAQDFRFIIAGLTLRGANILASLKANHMYFYIPTINKNSTSINASNIYFGGIDYDAQIQSLLSLSNGNIASFYDNSALSNNLNQKLINQTGGVRTYTVVGEKINFPSLLRSKGSLSGASVFLNTPLVKSAIISSQLRSNGMYPYAILSTQIGYNPTFLSLTQAEDRRKMIIANSILNDDLFLSHANEMLNQSLDYNWVAYATSLGLDYFYSQKMNKASSLFKEKMQDNQIVYKIKLMQSLDFSFKEY